MAKRRGYHFALLVYFLMCTAQELAASRAGYEYIVEADAWLRLHIVPATWSDARLRCHLEGGVLASPTTTAIATAMSAMMADSKMTTRFVFIGVHALISKGDFMSLDGVPLANLSIRWREWEPNNVKNNEDCVTIDGAGEANDVSCDSPHPYFCRKETAKMTVNKCGTTADGYKLEPRTGSCYKLHRLARNWHRAAMACHAEEAHLAVINSNLESQVLKEIFAAVPNNVIKSGDPNFAFVGVWDWNEHGEWLTVFGESLPEAGFDGWSPNEPNNAGGQEFCGSIKRDGLLNDYPCLIRLPFICEITPK
ncbi:secretory phospholipase A2 receptor-like [Leguminivora glycinivorella]|uniref:secretory phospholipase A2 receptor-like n=1 Tax=Leguminivora glycinivorella TaxID=1035111 RepID=UPI00200DEDF2|nr:secretory phospholipase A2 receptor-like [Leguminivora glycinivorella]